MKIVAISVLFLANFWNLAAQSGIIERQKENAKNKINNRIENKIDNGIDKTLDKVEDVGKRKESGNQKKGKKDIENQGQIASPDAVNSKSSETSPNSNVAKSEVTPKNFNSYSKFDFVRGEKILMEEKFENTEVGDFPTGWNTNASAEIVRLGENNEKWISFKQDGFYSPESIKEYPENFTLEFDIFTRNRSSNILAYGFEIGATENPSKLIGGDIYYMASAFRFSWLGCNEAARYMVFENGEIVNENENLVIRELDCGETTDEYFSKVHFSIWRQKNRLRVYINENKVIDIPYGLPVKYNYNIFRLTGTYMNFAIADEPDEFMLSNMVYAVGAPDTRSKLITAGKLVTRGIQFDVNSSDIKAESYGTMKEIATALTENPMVKVKIIGHTDSDGDEKTNLLLSQKRAASVKKSLTEDFKIAADRMETDGKGEIEPTDPNTTNVGKANNRRVEFIKL